MRIVEMQTQFFLSKIEMQKRRTFGATNQRLIEPHYSIG